ncbi:MAG: IS91 family transposase, partial [Nitrososphaera sp.]
QCRTKLLGGVTQACTQCGYVDERWFSCRNRHCPKCQGALRWKWVGARLKELLPISYDHVVCTLPPLLNVLTLYNKEVIYEIFYQATAATLLTFGWDPKYLGAELGFIAILHTWGQTLNYHVHWHFIVSGGGITVPQGGKQRWKHLPYRKKFLFWSEAVSRVICGKFLEMLDAAYRRGELQFPKELGYLNNPAEFEDFKDKIWQQAWYCYAKPPFAGPEKLIKYIGSYTHRVAISDHRLLNIEDGNITFSYKDYRNEGKRKEMSLRWEVFIQRWLWHVVPKGFRRIRYGGFLAGNTRQKKMALARQLLGVLQQQVISQLPTTSWGNDFDPEVEMKCPLCQSGTMILIESIPSRWAGQRPPGFTRARRVDSS